MLQRTLTGEEAGVHGPAALVARILRYLPPKDGVGNAGRMTHPQPRVRLEIEAHERSHHRSVRFTRHSRTRMVLTVSSVLSPATNSFCHRRLRIDGFAAPGWAWQDLRELSISNGCQDHTASPSATASLVLHADRSLTRFISPCDARRA